MMEPAEELRVRFFVAVETVTELGSTLPERMAVVPARESSKVTASNWMKRSAAAPLRQLAAPLAELAGSPEFQVEFAEPFHVRVAGAPVTTRRSVPGVEASKATLWRPPAGRPPQPRVAVLAVEAPPETRV